MTTRNTMLTTVGYMPTLSTAFGSAYRGPVFEVETGAGAPDAVAIAAAAATAAAAKTAADKITADAAAAALLAAGGNKTTATTATTDAEAKLLREVMEGKAAAKALKDELAALTAKFVGVDPAKFAELTAAARATEEAALVAKGDFTALTKRMADEHTAALDAQRKLTLAETNKATALQSTIRELTVGTAFVSSKFLNEETVLPPDIAKVAFDSYFEVEDGRVVGYDKPRGTAGRLPYINGQGTGLGFDEVMKRIVESSPNADRVLKSKRAAGAGSSSVDVGAAAAAAANAGNGSFSPGSGLAKIAANIGALKIGQKK